tara:strand:+ start:814 stop:1068 length:255 start_codon:yes stop_codon:yes gene_type:complete
MEKLENLKKKIIYRSQYRGTKEMDMLLHKFVKYYIDELDSKDLYDLHELLKIEDEILFNFYQFGKKNESLQENRISSLFKNFKI